MLLKASIAGLTMDQASNTPIILLKTEGDNQVVPIWIGLLEATSIASALQNIKFDRPMTHDLFKNMAQQLKVDVTMVEICDLKDNTFFARLHLTAEGNSLSLDSRPSDAIAIAIRFQAPIFVDEKVVAKSKKTDGSVEISDQSEEGQKLAEYLKSLTSDDFGKYKI